MGPRRRLFETNRLSLLHFTGAAVLVLVGFWLRFQAAKGELWFDEIWSLNAALGLDAWHEAFWKLPKDNNHPLNTWWLYMAGDNRENWVYHLLSVTTGTASIVVAGWVAVRRATSHKALRLLGIMTLVAVLYPFVNFGSEARGYGPMMLWALLAFAAVEDSDRPLKQVRWSYSLAGLLGVLSHFSMLPILWALSISFALHHISQGRTVLQAVHATVRLNAPLVGGLLLFILAMLYGVYAQGVLLGFGGSTLTCGDQNCFTMALGEMVRFSTGGGENGTANLYTALYFTITIACVGGLWAVGNDRALPLGLIVFGVPALFYVFGQPALPHGRYFFAVFIFIPVLLIEVLAELSHNGLLVRIAAFFLLLALIGINAKTAQPFLSIGRGNTEQALQYILDQSPPGPIDIGTDMKVQLKTVMEHVKKSQAAERAINIVKYKNIERTQPLWLISVTIHTNHLPPQTCVGKQHYSLVQGYEHWGMSGSTWGLYRLNSTPAPKDCSWLKIGP